jgi:hypothetical protein
VTSLQVVSQAGTRCRLCPPWPSGVKVIDDAGQNVECAAEDFGRISFATRSGGKYRLEPK